MITLICEWVFCRAYQAQQWKHFFPTFDNRVEHYSGFVCEA